MNRRSFLQMMLGSVTAAVAAPLAAPVAEKIYPAGTRIAVNFVGRTDLVERFFHASFYQPFDMRADMRSLRVDVGSGFRMRQLSLCCNPEAPFRELSNFISRTNFRLSENGKSLMVAPTYFISVTSGICGPSVPFQLYPEYRVAQPLCFEMASVDANYKPSPDVRGSIFISGVRGIIKTEAEWEEWDRQYAASLIEDDDELGDLELKAYIE